MADSAVFDLPVGDSLAGVEYQLLPSDTIRTDDVLDVVSLGVTLVFASGIRRTFSWQLYKLAGALVVSAAETENSLA